MTSATTLHAILSLPSLLCLLSASVIPSSYDNTRGRQTRPHPPLFLLLFLVLISGSVSKAKAFWEGRLGGDVYNL